MLFFLSCLAARLNLRINRAEVARRTAIALRLVHAAPDVILSLVGDVARAWRASSGIFLVTDADVLLYNVGDAARAGGAGAGIFLVTDADIVTLLLAPIADVRQNDRVEVALGAPAVSGGRGVTRVVAARVALVAIVRPENGGAHVPTVGTAAPVLAAGTTCRAVFGCHVGAVGLVAEEDVGSHVLCLLGVACFSDTEKIGRGGNQIYSKNFVLFFIVLFLSCI